MNDERDFVDDFVDAEGAESLPVEDAVSDTVQDEPMVEVSGNVPVRGPDGKFMRKEAEDAAEAVEKGAIDDADEPPSDSNETHVPISVVQALRKELQGYKKQADPNQQPQTAPEFSGPQTDLQRDPAGYIQGTLHQQKMQMSKFMAEQQESPDTVTEAWHAFDQACNADPSVSAFSQSLVNHPHPMGEVVKWHKQQSELLMLRDAGGLDALIERKLAERSGVAPASNGNAKPNTPPSLAGRGGAGKGQQSASEKDVFDDMFS